MFPDKGSNVTVLSADSDRYSAMMSSPINSSNNAVTSGANTMTMSSKTNDSGSMTKMNDSGAMTTRTNDTGFMTTKMHDNGTTDMSTQNSKTTSMCSDNEGILPSCAPLAVPYVPFQQTGSKRYNHTEALNNGTLFPSLNLPFHVKTKGTDMVSNALAELQALSFVVQELSLYLDTHPDDKEAFSLFQQYVSMKKEGMDRYEKMYGPISRNATANGTEYTWIKNPWPWDYQEGK